MAHNDNTTVRQKWNTAFRNSTFKRKFISAFIVLLLTVSALPFFFRYIEQREGMVLHDIILAGIAPQNVSLFIFLVIWTITILTLVRAVQQPSLFILLMVSFTIMTLVRIASITFFALNPPPGLIVLKDPLSNFFYGNTFITKDLFFSGHTATMFLMYLCLEKRPEKYLALAAAVLTGFLVLLQHVHYSIDVLAAPVVTWLAFRLAKAWLKPLSFTSP